jgi:putative membrane protein
VQGFIASSLVVLVSAPIITALLKLEDSSTIATFRRTIAVIMTGQLIWLILVGIADAYSFATRSNQPSANAFLFGAFITAGFEFLVIRGAFTQNLALSMTLAIVHPVATFFSLGTPTGAVQYPPAPILGGLASLFVVAAFPLALSRRKTSRGHDAVKLFQAFMKTWTEKDSADLETIIQDHAEASSVTTKAMRFQREDGAIFLLPGVHPGPFFPVGSYNMPGLISKEMAELGPVLTLHRPGGHERNLANNDQARSYASELKELAKAIEPVEPGTMRGPIQARIGNATVNSLAFSKDLLLTISFAPLGSDDLETQVEERLAELSTTRGFSASVVDAHNSISRGQEHPDMQDEGWSNIIEATSRSTPESFEISYAHSREVNFSPGEDITENGVGLLMLQSGGTKSVLILADANNSIPELRERASRALDQAGYKLIEFCTSDSHDLAAKGLTVTRGYVALGEDTPMDSIIALIVALARMAESRLQPCKYGSGELTRKMELFGPKSLDEFASITTESSKFALDYFKFAVLSVLALFAVSTAL